MLTGFITAVEVHFETPDSGFFLKHSSRSSDISNSPIKPGIDESAILSVDRFTIVETTQPVSIRASYGPFSTKQTVPARFIVPDSIDLQGDHLQVNKNDFNTHI